MGRNRGTLLFAASIATAIVVACGSNGGNGTSGGGDGGNGGDGASSSSSGAGSGSGFSSSGAGDASADADFPCDGCAPFPPEDAGACSPGTLGDPTLVYPPDGVLLPPNMNVLEVQWLPPQGAALFEVDFTNSVTNIRVETTCNPVPAVRAAADGGVTYSGCGLTLSQQEWNDIANTNRDGDPVKIVVRATPASGSCVTASQQSVSVAFAKDNLTGGIYYWQSVDYGQVAGHAGGIYYHDFGTFNPTPTPFWTTGGMQNNCVGCHTLSKDGVQMSLMQDDADADDEYSDVRQLTVNVPTRTATGGMMMSPGFQTFTHDHALMLGTDFSGMMMMPPMMNMTPDTAFSVWTGDGKTMVTTNTLPSGMQGTQPNLSWDDTTVVFVAPSYGTIATQTTDVPGGLGGAGGDDHFMAGSLWTANFNKTTGAMTSYQAIAGAAGSLGPGSTGTVNGASVTCPGGGTSYRSFYYPDQSVDGNWIVFNENDDGSVGNNCGDGFYSRQSVVKIMHFPPQAGDVPLALNNLNVGNGLSNSWPRWSPAVTSYHGHPVLWVTFSSNRDYGLHLKNSGFDNYYPPEGPVYDQPQPASKQNILFDSYAQPQIWMAGVIVDPTRSIDSMDRSYPAFWLPFQEVSAHNHSAQWVAQVQGPPGGEGGTSSSSGGNAESGPSCGESGAACGTGDPLCCTDVVCCAGTCQNGCTQ